MKKNSLWLLRFYMAVAAYYYHEKVRRTMRTAIVSYLFKYRFYYNINLPHVTVEQNFIHYECFSIEQMLFDASLT